MIHSETYIMIFSFEKFIMLVSRYHIRSNMKFQIRIRIFVSFDWIRITFLPIQNSGMDRFIQHEHLYTKPHKNWQT